MLMYSDLADILTGDLHEVVDVGHGLAVVDGGGGLGAVQVADVADPLIHGGRVLPSHTLDAPRPGGKTYIISCSHNFVCAQFLIFLNLSHNIRIQISTAS